MVALHAQLVLICSPLVKLKVLLKSKYVVLKANHRIVDIIIVRLIVDGQSSSRINSSESLIFKII